MRRLFYWIGLLVFFLGSASDVSSQTLDGELKTAKLLSRTQQAGDDNYAYAAYSFALSGNGPDVQKLCRNNWEILFGNSPDRDSFDVTMVGDDRSRIKDLGRRRWSDRLHVPKLAAYEEPEYEPSVDALVGHIYLVHSRDSSTNLYTLFRVENLKPGESVEISWKTIPAPQRP